MVIAILHIVLGCTGLFCELGYLVYNAIGVEKMVEEMFAEPEPEEKPPPAKGKIELEIDSDMEVFLAKTIPNYELGQRINSILEIVFSLTLIVAGVGLLRMAAWSWWLSVGYSLLDIAWRLNVIVVLVLVVSPALQEFFQQQSGDIEDPAERMGVAVAAQFVSISMIAFVALYLVYPLLVLIVMFLPSVRQAFRDPCHNPEVVPPIDRPEATDPGG
jgi:hypothetical protein